MIFEACTSHRLRPTPARAAAQVPRSSQEVAVLQTAIFEYLGTLRTGLLSEEKSARIQFLTQAVVTFESIASSIFDKLTRIYDLRARIARGALPEPARGSERG